MVKPGSAAWEHLGRFSTPKKLNLKAQYRKKKWSFAQALLDYLTSDSFMYGPLLSPPPKRPAPLHTEDAHDGTGMSPRTSPLSHNSHNEGGMHSSPTSSRLHRMSTFTRRLLWSIRTSTKNIENGTELAPAAFEVHKYGEETTLRPPLKGDEKVADENEGNDDGNLTDQVVEEEEEDESSRSVTESQTENNVTPLHKEAAMEVARRLVRKVGGRFSKELGIFVDIRDSEVERWFLATTFLSHPSEFELAKQMFKKLHAMGISKIQDVLSIEQSELEEAFQNMMHNHRIASRLQKIALGLRTDHGGGICTLKCISDYAKLKQDLENLSGYGRRAARMFLREMRGVWPGASPEFEMRTRNAAKHLHLPLSIKDGVDGTSILVDLAQDAGLDERDLEVALAKVSFQHARQYRTCPGGRECEFARITLSDLDHLIVNL